MEEAAGLRIELRDLQALRRLNEELRAEKARRIRQKLPGVIRLAESLHISSLNDAANLWVKQILQQPLWGLKRLAEHMDVAQVQALLSSAHFLFSVALILLSEEADVFLLDVRSVKRLLRLGVKLYKIFRAARQHFFLEAATVDLCFQKAQYQTIAHTWREICAAGRATLFAGGRKAAGKKLQKKAERRESYVDPEFRRRRDEIERMASTNGQKESFVAELLQIDPFIRSALSSNAFGIVTSDARALEKLAQYAHKIFRLDHLKAELVSETAQLPSSSRREMFGANVRQVVMIQRWYRRVRGKEPEGVL